MMANVKCDLPYHRLARYPHEEVIDIKHTMSVSGCLSDIFLEAKILFIDTGAGKADTK